MVELVGAADSASPFDVWSHYSIVILSYLLTQVNFYRFQEMLSESLWTYGDNVRGYLKLASCLILANHVGVI